MPDTNVVECSCNKIDFSGAHLRRSSFHLAKLREANFSLANLWEADFTNSTITESQLQSALSIRNAKLPNGTLGHSRNWIENGDANCNNSLVNHWHIQYGSIAILFKPNLSECHFSLQSPTTGAMMSQRINLTHIWNSSFWRFLHVELEAHMSSEVSIELIGKDTDAKVVNNKIASKLRILIMNDT
jgi:uncharacterized protein YjbI with pentapeptide repeats